MGSTLVRVKGSTLAKRVNISMEISHCDYSGFKKPVTMTEVSKFIESVI